MSGLLHDELEVFYTSRMVDDVVVPKFSLQHVTDHELCFGPLLPLCLMAADTRLFAESLFLTLALWNRVQGSYEASSANTR